MSEQNKEKTWWKRNRKKVYIVSAAVLVGTLGYIGFKNKDELFKLIKSNTSALEKTAKDNIHAATPIVEKTASSTISELDLDVCENVVHSDTAKRIINNGQPFPVRLHPRNLGEHRFPSAKKINEAKTLGLELGPHQTFVNNYEKNAA